MHIQVPTRPPKATNLPWMCRDLHLHNQDRRDSHPGHLLRWVPLSTLGSQQDLVQTLNSPPLEIQTDRVWSSLRLETGTDQTSSLPHSEEEESQAGPRGPHLPPLQIWTTSSRTSTRSRSWRRSWRQLATITSRTLGTLVERRTSALL